MATIWFPHSSFNNGEVVVDFSVNDANWRVSQARCINNSQYPVTAFIFKSGVQIFTATAPAGQTTTWNTSGIQLGWDGIDGGIMMMDYVIQIQYPSEV